MKVYSFSEARQNFASVLDLAQKDGSVRITRRDGQAFVIQPDMSSKSPLAVKGISVGITKQEILDAIHEGRYVRDLP